MLQWNSVVGFGGRGGGGKTVHLGSFTISTAHNCTLSTPKRCSGWQYGILYCDSDLERSEALFWVARSPSVCLYTYNPQPYTLKCRVEAITYKRVHGIPWNSFRKLLMSRPSNWYLKIYNLYFRFKMVAYSFSDAYSAFPFLLYTDIRLSRANKLIMFLNIQFVSR